ncbi:hypothetical protein ACRALDRAFT_1060081, partial [Sodiomyces alcalophilus JCM 7366]|uniref:uncharacterized protein n=1 Tax=Sodiomyces alcalophilus JCM 7366 TaxID=591952 RepID=UPI0039B691B0
MAAKSPEEAPWQRIPGQPKPNLKGKIKTMETDTGRCVSRGRIPSLPTPMLRHLLPLRPSFL